MTSIIRRNPFEEIASLWPREFFGHDLFGRPRAAGGADLEWSPSCDVSESADAITVHAELPGVAEKDIEVSVSGSRLVVRGEKRSEKKEEEKGRTYSERFFGSFERSISLPEDVDASKIEAKLKDGVLEVRVPLPAKPAAEVKKIPVQGA